MVVDQIETWAKLAAPTISALSIAAFKLYAEAKPRVISYLVQASQVPLGTNDQGVPTFVNFHSIVVANTGKKTATGVRVSHRIQGNLPAHTIFPPTQYSIQNNPEGYPEIVFPTLVAKQQVTISYIYFPPLYIGQILGDVLSNEGMGKILQVVPKPRPNRYASVAIWVLAGVGASFILFWVIRWLFVWALLR